MSLDFNKMQNAVAHQFAVMSKHDLFVTGVDKDAVWAEYLKSFPEGSNPMFRKRSEHDCGCCKNFLRNAGNVVAIIDGKIVSLWDTEIGDPNYQAVANALSAFVKSQPISDVFLHHGATIGTAKNHEFADDKSITWEHFFLRLPVRNSGRAFFCAGKDIATTLGEYRAQHDVLARGLKELTLESTDTVLELIAQNSLYRGQEHKGIVTAFRKLKLDFDKLPEKDRDAFVWARIGDSQALAKIRNTSIGTLLIDLSEGMDMEEAVRKFEKMVAPENYKRPTALVTPKMVEAARTQVEALGLTSALERRFATLMDVSVNNIIFANRVARKVMKDDIFSQVPTKARDASKTMSKVETVGIQKFIDEIVPNVESIEVFVENSQVNNLVSLIAPADPKAGRLFKWNNDFSWSYNGNMADSIKERVKQAGGNVVGDLCCRLAWYNFDDLDLHMHEPKGTHIYYGNRGPAGTGGQLDIDMNAGAGHSKTPVENIFYPNRQRMFEGEYHLLVNQFRMRESQNVGFEVEIDYLGNLYRFVYDKAVRQGESITVARFKYSQANGVEMISSLAQANASKEVWGISTQQFHKVNVLMHSPNFWDDQHGIGHKHYFFMLDGCTNDGSARGFFNEFLRSELDKHRKVIELVGSKATVENTPNQLSGLGFSETKHTELLVRVKGNFTRDLKIVI